MNLTPADITINNGPLLQGALSIETEWIDVTMSRKSEPDKRWEYVDQTDHFHAFAADDTLPTLEARTEHVNCDEHEDDCEGYNVTVYSCIICGEIVKPAYVTTYPSLGSDMIPGRTMWQVQVEADIPRDSRVSVKATTGESVYFGAGVATTRKVEGGSGGIRFTTTIVGIGPLGQRKASVSTT